MAFSSRSGRPERTALTTWTTRVSDTVRALRRWVLIHRRGLAALLLAVAVFSGLRTVRPADPVLTTAWVAARDLPAGARLSAGDLTRAHLPADLVPDGRLRSPDDITLAGAVRRGEVLTDARVLGPGLTRGAPDLVALPVRIPDAGAVDLLRVGDAVDLIAVPVQSVPGAGPSGGTADRGHLVASGVPVLAILPAGREAGGSPAISGGRLVVLGVARGATMTVASAAARDWLTIALHG